jgi:hypothetical protein
MRISSDKAPKEAQLFSYKSADFFRLRARRVDARADRPYGFVCDDKPSVNGDAGKRFADLFADGFKVRARLPFGRAFSDAHHRLKAARVDRRYFFFDGPVGFGKIFPAFGMADQHILRPGFRNHRAGNLARISAGRFVMRILRADLYT